MDSDWLARGVAIVGLGVGIWNAWAQYQRDAMRLKVTPLLRQGAGSIPSYLEGVQIVNHSAFPVQLVEVGVIDNDGKELKFLSTESPVIGEVVLIKERSSQKITPTTHAAILSALSNLKSCYAKTGEGKIFTGKIRNLKRVELRKPFDR